MFKQEISGWGGYPIHKAEVLTPSSLMTFRSEIQKQNLQNVFYRKLILQKQTFQRQILLNVIYRVQCSMPQIF